MWWQGPHSTQIVKDFMTKGLFSKGYKALSMEIFTLKWIIPAEQTHSLPDISNQRCPTFLVMRVLFHVGITLIISLYAFLWLEIKGAIQIQPPRGPFNQFIHQMVLFMPFWVDRSSGLISVHHPESSNRIWSDHQAG